MEGRIKDLIRKEIKIDRAENGYDHDYFETSIEKSANTQKEFEELTEQEQAILSLYAEGYTVREIAESERVSVHKSRVHEVLQGLRNKPDKSSLTYDNKLGKENGKAKSETSDDEKYAFSDFLSSDKTREEAEYERHKNKPRSGSSKKYDPDKSKIDFQGLTWQELVEKRGGDMSVDPQNHYQGLLWQAGYEWKNLNGPGEKTKEKELAEDLSSLTYKGEKVSIGEMRIDLYDQTNIDQEVILNWGRERTKEEWITHCK